MIYTLDEIKKRILPVIEKYDIPAMYLFGSYARGEATEESDLDFLVDTAGTNLTSLLALGALYKSLPSRKTLYIWASPCLRQSAARHFGSC